MCVNIRKSTRAITKLFENALRPTGLRATHFILLVATRVMGTATINNLVKGLVMDRTRLTRNLRPLEQFERAEKVLHHFRFGIRQYWSILYASAKH